MKNKKSIFSYYVKLVREETKEYFLGEKIDSSNLAKELVKNLIDTSEWHNERIGMVCMNAQNTCVGIHIVHEGTVSETNVFVREFAVRALLNNAVSVILFHNHPGGSLKPSSADINATRNIKAGLETLTIKLIDHIIITETGLVSLAERGDL